MNRLSHLVEYSCRYSRLHATQYFSDIDLLNSFPEVLHDCCFSIAGFDSIFKVEESNHISEHI